MKLTLLLLLCGVGCEAGVVVIEQPKPDAGDFGCREVVKSDTELLQRDAGCWTMDEFQCIGSHNQTVLPFKWGHQCYAGRIRLPPGLCVDGFAFDGSGSHACSSPQTTVLFSFCGDSTNSTVHFGDSDHRACALQFYRSTHLPVGNGTVTLSQPEPYQGDYSCSQVNMPENLLLSNRYNCWTMNQFTCPDGGDLPFKWGDDCYLGDISLPDDLCVQGLRLTGAWNLASPQCGDAADIMFSYCGGGRHDVSEGHQNELFEPRNHNKVCALRFFKPPPASGRKVLFEQPMEQLGKYACRQVEMDENELLEVNHGCWTANMFQCPGTQGAMKPKNIPFIWGASFPMARSCYLGRITLPHDLCVDIMPLGRKFFDTWDADQYCWSAREKPLRRICGGGYHDFSDLPHSACGFRFSRHQKTTGKPLRIDAKWEMLHCSSLYYGEISHIVTVGVTNTSGFGEEFGERIKNSFDVGMEFNIGHAKNQLTAEQKRMLVSAWDTSTSRVTHEKFDCHMYGGAYCMWQWHMTFSNGSQAAHWNAPILMCARGSKPPTKAPHNTVIRIESVVKASALEPVGQGAKLGASMAIVICLAAALRWQRSRTHKKDLKEPLCTAS